MTTSIRLRILFFGQFLKSKSIPKELTERTAGYSVFELSAKPRNIGVLAFSFGQRRGGFRVSPVMSRCGARKNSRLAARFFLPLLRLVAHSICRRQRSRSAPLRYVCVYSVVRRCRAIYYSAKTQFGQPDFVAARVRRIKQEVTA